jgi:hypothetical protein
MGQEKEPVAWITRGGKHIPIFDTDYEPNKEKQIEANKKQAQEKNAKPSLQEMKDKILSSKFQDHWAKTRDPEGKILRSRIVDPETYGAFDIARLDGKASDKRMASLAGMSYKELLDTMKALHPNADVEIKSKYSPRNKYARGGATPAYTSWTLYIKSKE